MSERRIGKTIYLILISIACMLVGTIVFAGDDATGIGKVAQNVTGNLANIARLVTAGSYIAGMAFAVGSIVKFKAHKDNPTQIPIGMPIALLFVGAALIFMPSVFKTSGSTLFGASGTVAGVSGITKFGATQAGT